MKRLVSFTLVATGAGALAQQQSNWFASSVVSYAGLAAAPYGDPTAALGKPTTWVADPIMGGANQRVAASLGYGAFGLSPTGQPLVVTIQPGGQITVEFYPPITNDPRHWYGYDFIVFGNSFFSTQQPVTATSNMANVLISNSGDWIEPSSVSVSPDGIQWYAYPLSAYQAADAYWPTQAHAWDRTANSWSSEQDWTRPVPPGLTRSHFSGRSIADAIDQYQKSAGGAAFDLTLSGFSWIRYIRITGTGNEIDGISRVGFAQYSQNPPKSSPPNHIKRSPL